MLQTAREEKTDNIVVMMTKKSDLHVSLDITVLPKATEASYAMAIKAINKEVSLPGFRKGKAPVNVIAKEFKKSIQNEWTQITYNMAIQEALHLMNVHPFSREGIKCSSITEPTLEKGAHFVIEFETPPVVPEIATEKYHAKEIKPLPITEGDISGVINNVRSYFATFKEIDDRPAQENDFLELDIEKLDEPKEMLCEDHRFHANAEQMANWMRALVLGNNVGESVEGLSEKEGNESEEEFIPTRCRITIKKILEATLPELTDEFANKIGMPSVKALKEKITADLVDRAEKTARAKNRELLDKWLLKEYPIVIPESMILNEMKGRMNTAMENWRKSGAPEAGIKTEAKKLEPHFREQAENSCRLYMILMAYGKRHQISLTKEEVAQSSSQRLLQQFHSADPGATEKEIQSLVAQAAMLNKARDIIIAHATQKKA